MVVPYEKITVVLTPWVDPNFQLCFSLSLMIVTSKHISSFARSFQMLSKILTDDYSKKAPQNIKRSSSPSPVVGFMRV